MKITFKQFYESPDKYEAQMTEATLQTILKKSMKPVGTIKRVFGDDAEAAQELLGCNDSDQAYELKGDDPQTKAALSSAKHYHGDKVRLMKLIGSRKAVAYHGRLITSKAHYDSLVEAQIDGKQVSNAFSGYLSPFKTNHSWVEDAKGRTVCEAQDKGTAKILCDLLNKTYPAKSKT